MIDLDYLIGVNSAICEEFGYKSVMINENNLLSALSVQQWYDKEYELASALFRSIIISHGFRDGNKRTAVIIAASICEFDCDDLTLERCAIDVAIGKLKDVQEISKILYGDHC